MARNKTIKSHSTKKIDEELKKKDRKSFEGRWGLKAKIIDFDKQLRKLYHDLLGLESVDSKDLGTLLKSIDEYNKFKKEILSKVEERLKPMDWNE